MNKTVNINLGGLIFYIDENAYQKLRNYLNAVKKSFTGSSGEDEIISDIETRISELFSEKLQHNRQVVTLKEVDEIINTMGQPEDYMVDEDIFEDTTNNNSAHNKKQKNTTRKLFRDTENSNLAGVCSGLSHYLGIDAIWLRLLLIVTVLLGGSGVIIYILFWILMPEAKTTADKIAMMGVPINISNIEKKIKEGFDIASKTVKNVDYKNAQNGVLTFFNTIGNLLVAMFKFFGKFIGILLVVLGASSIISLLVGLFTTSTFSIFNFGLATKLELYDYALSLPIWILSLIAFFAISIPFFFLTYLGLKIVITNLKSIGSVAKFSLLGLWLFSVIFMSTEGIKTGLRFNENATVIIKEELPITANDTLHISMIANELFSTSMKRRANEQFVYNENDDKQIFTQNIRLIIKSTTGNIAKIKIRKQAGGVSYKAAKARAEDIKYSFTLENNHLKLNNYLIASSEQKYNNQHIEITLYLPEGTTIYADENTYYYHQNNDTYNDILENGDEAHYLQILKNKTKCLDCKTIDFEDDEENKLETGQLSIDENGLKINFAGNKNKKVFFKIDKNGIKVKTENIK